MNPKTKSYAREIQMKVKNSLTKQKEFASEQEVIDYAVRDLYESLKKNRVI